MKFESKKKIQSKLAGFEDVHFTLKKMTEGRRTKLNLSLAPHKAKLRDLMAEAESLNPAVEEGQDAPKLDAQTVAKVQNIHDALNSLVESEINPAWFRYGLDKIEGLEIDGAQATVETLMSDGPSELFTEILQAIRTEAELSPEEIKN
jgi:hypothetical protein